MKTADTAVRVVRHSDGVVELLLDDAEHGNALNLETAEALRTAAADIADEPGGAVLLRARGRNFCVGGDLRAFASQGSGLADYVHKVAQAASDAVELLYALPVPVVTAVQGAAAGGGVGLALVGDVVLAAESAKFRLAYSAIGLTPDCGASWLLPRLIGPRRTLDLALTNRTLTAAQAEDWGLVSRVVTELELGDSARSMAASLAADGAGAASCATKRLIRDAAHAGPHEQLAAEARSIAELAGTAHARERIASFLAR